MSGGRRLGYGAAIMKPEDAKISGRDLQALRAEGEYWRWCPRCGHELHNEKCKLRCPQCHYFMSCSDFD